MSRLAKIGTACSARTSSLSVAPVSAEASARLITGLTQGIRRSPLSSRQLGSVEGEPQVVTLIGADIAICDDQCPSGHCGPDRDPGFAGPRSGRRPPKALFRMRNCGLLDQAARERDLAPHHREQQTPRIARRLIETPSIDLGIQTQAPRAYPGWRRRRARARRPRHAPPARTGDCRAEERQGSSAPGRRRRSNARDRTKPSPGTRGGR